MRTSYSSLDTFKTCPLKYKFQEIDKIRVPKGVELIFGSTIHSALKYMFERGPLYPTIDQVIDFFRNTWDHRKSSVNWSEGQSVEDQEELFYKEGISLLEKFYKKNQPWNFNVVDLESRFDVDLEDPKNKEKHILAGFIDRIDKENESYEIIDYKTARKMPSQDIINNDFQLSVYHLGLMKRWPHLDPKKVKLSLYYIKHGEKISTSRTSEQLEETKKFVIKTINEIEEKIKDNYNFPPLPSALCDWCGYKQMCPMFKHLYTKKYEQNKIANQEELNNSIKEYFEIKAKSEENTERLNELKSVIYAFMDDQKVDRVFGDDGYLTKKNQEKFSYDLDKVKEILEPNDKKLTKILPSLPEEIQEKILSTRTKKEYSILTASRKKIEE